MAAELSEAMIEQLVRVFYARARQDPLLGPVFEHHVEDWDRHTKVIADFWSQALLGTRRYSGRPFPAHAALPLRAAHFDAWLALFRAVADETLPAAGAALAVRRAEDMATGFRAGLFGFYGAPRRSPGPP